MSSTWDDAAFRRLPRAALQIRLIVGALAAIAVLVALIVADVLFRRATDLDLKVPRGLVPAVATAVFAVVVGLATWVGWRVTGWRLDDRLFAVRDGVYTRRWVGVPRDRVQSVLVSSNPLQRWRGLATLTVRTAGARTPAVVLADIDAADAEVLRSELAPAREPEQAGR